MVDHHTGAVWDLSSYFPGFHSPEMQSFKESLVADLKTLTTDAENLKALAEQNMDQWDTLILKAENIASRLGHLSSYVGCLEAADAQTEAYAVEQAALTKLYAEFEKYEVAVLNRLKTGRKKAFQSLIQRQKLATAGHYLKRLQERSKTTMSRKEEILAADLNIDGMTAWGRLYNKITGKLEFDLVTPDGNTERRPISQWRSLMSHPDRSIGRAAFEGGNRAWQQIEDVCAAALNGIAGTRLSLHRHRKVDHFLDQALFQAAISRPTLEAMYQAVFDQIGTARDILRTKAGFFNRSGIWFFEREAPLPMDETKTFTWPEATELTAEAFMAVYPDLAAHFSKMLADRWIESEPRPAKRPGAFCTSSTWIDEQRVFMTFNQTLGDVTTLAHEVGHAWHSRLMRGMRPFARRYPMTLAETASIFAEHILMTGLLQNAAIDDRQKLLLLDSELTDAAVFLLDITTRFEFEKSFYEKRQQGEVTVSQLKDLMAETQHTVYGDALLADGIDPYFWASKLHFYITGVSFYNFPYTFGYLLARALIHRFHREGMPFLTSYERFLRSSGSDTVENVADQTLGVDVSDTQFWTEAILSLLAPLDQYREKINQHRL